MHPSLPVLSPAFLLHHPYIPYSGFIFVVANIREMLEVAVRINFRGSKIRGAANDARISAVRRAHV